MRMGLAKFPGQCLEPALTSLKVALVNGVCRRRPRPNPIIAMGERAGMLHIDEMKTGATR